MSSNDHLFRISILEYITKDYIDITITPDERKTLLKDIDTILAALELISDRLKIAKMKVSTHDYNSISEPIRELPPLLQELVTMISNIVFRTDATTFNTIKNYSVSEPIKDVIVKDKNSMRLILRIAEWFSHN